MKRPKAELCTDSAASLELADKHPHHRNKARNDQGGDKNVSHGDGKRGGKDSSHKGAAWLKRAKTRFLVSTKPPEAPAHGCTSTNPALSKSTVISPPAEF